MCELCAGTLLAGPLVCPTCGENGLDCLGYDVGEEHVCGTVLPGTPCPRCLSVPATPELREMAREWLGDSQWPDLDPGPWYASEAPVAPAYLGAGRDLLARDLARTLGREVGATAPWWREGDNGWELWVNGVVVVFTSDPTVEHCPPGQWYVPALATTPAGAPPDLRAARDLVLAHQEVSRAV